MSFVRIEGNLFSDESLFEDMHVIRKTEIHGVLNQNSIGTMYKSKNHNGFLHCLTHKICYDYTINKISFYRRIL